LLNRKNEIRRSTLDPIQNPKSADDKSRKLKAIPVKQKMEPVMRILKPVSAIGLILLLAGTYPVAGGDEQQTVSKDAKSQSLGIADDKTASKLLKGIVHLGDDDIRFRTAGGVNVFVDPVSWPTDEAVVKSGMVKPDLILITHSHGDHFQPTMLREYLSLNPKAVLAGPPDVAREAREKGMKATEINPGQSYTMAGVKFSAVPACFLEGDSHPKANQWVGYVLQLNGVNYYVTGDTQPLPEMAKLKVDVLFPLLYGCGGNLDQAVKMAELTKAHLVVPVHTGGQEEVIKKFMVRLPEGVQGAYYNDTKLVVTPRLE
jgi:L-ascorbate metabolism protein UlaG (beta-lactamase superfamily)